MPAAIDACVADHLQHRVDLMEAREDQRFLAIILVEMNETPDNVEQYVAGEDRLPFLLIGPQVGDTEFAVDVRISGSANVAATAGTAAGKGRGLDREEEVPAPTRLQDTAMSESGTEW